jgi:hypothetical protein
VPAKSTKPKNVVHERNPHVIVDFVFDRGQLSISISNIGTQPAYGVKVEFSHKLMGVEGTVEVSALPLFSQLEFLPGGKEITTYLDSSTSYFRSKQPTTITTQITYTDAASEEHTNTIRHNLEIYRGIGYTNL